MYEMCTEHGKQHYEQPVSHLKFEPGTSCIQLHRTLLEQEIILKESS